MFKTKIYIGIVTIVALGILSMFYIYQSLGNVAGYMATLDRISVPFSVAALEMEKNIGEYSNGALRYVSDPDAALRAEAAHDIEDYNQRHAVYMKLSTNAKERALGKKVGIQAKQLIAAGNQLMHQRDALDKVFSQTTALLEQVDALLDGPLMQAIPTLQPERSVVLVALQNIEAETAEIGYWLSMFKNRPTEQASKRLLEKKQEQHDAVDAFRKLPLSNQAQHLREQVHALHVKVAGNIKELIAGETEIARKARALDKLATDIDEIFDNEIQVMLTDDLAQPQQNADLAITHVQKTLRYIIPAYFIIALVVGILLIIAIIRPLKRLAAGTEAIGAGDLDYRIDERGNDEFGTLAGQFNLMAKRLRESTVSRDLLEASEKELQETVVELRQEIIERKQAEREREQLQAKLQRSETMAAMGRLVAGVAHEVRNPLFGISSTVDAMEASASSNIASPRYYEVLRRETRRLNALMTDLLEYGRTPPKDRTIEPIAGALADAAHHCHSMAAQAEVVVVNNASSTARVEMNRDRLLQIFVNLVENAVQHSPEKAQVIIATRQVTDAAGQVWVECSVADSGSGFDPDDLPYVFDPFFTRRRKGTGLGLAIAQRIVDEHHGAIEPGNRVEGGAIVKVRLPVIEESVA